MVAREGKGIKLFINPESNYGLSAYTPIKENHMWYKLYQRLKKSFDEDPEYTYHDEHTNKYNVHFTREETEKILHCIGCNASKMNNFKRYCACCEDFFDFYVNDWYYDTRSGKGYTKYTKKQIEDNLDLNNKDTFLPILKEMDYPYINSIWKENAERCKRNGWWIFSMYLTALWREDKEHLGWKGSEFE